MICEMFAYYKTHGISLNEKLDRIFKEYGYYTNSLQSYEFSGSDGFNKMQIIMRKLREEQLFEINGLKNY